MKDSLVAPAALAVVALVAVLVLPVSAALANCAQPVTYAISAQGSTVTICPENFGQRLCPDPDGMLRQDLATGEAVRIPERCKDTNGEACYLDSCVPAGTYHYGFTTPYRCHSSSCGTYYYEEITVEPWDGDCDAGDDLTPTATDSVPWSSDLICNYGDDPGTTDGGSGGCASVPTAGIPVPLQILGINGLMLLLGGVLLWRRRRK